MDRLCFIFGEPLNYSVDVFLSWTAINILLRDHNTTEGHQSYSLQFGWGGGGGVRGVVDLEEGGGVMLKLAIAIADQPPWLLLTDCVDSGITSFQRMLRYV